MCYCLKRFTLNHKIFHSIYDVFRKVTWNRAHPLPSNVWNRPRGVGINCLVALEREAWHNESMNGLECWAVGDPQFWQDLRLGTDPEQCIELIETVLEADGTALGPRDQAIHWTNHHARGWQTPMIGAEMKSWLCFEQDRNNGRQFSSKKGPFPTAGSSTLRYVEASGVRHKKCAEHHHSTAAPVTWAAL